MTKKLPGAFFFILLLIAAKGVCAQQTNSGEDYTAYLQETRATNSYLAHMPQDGSSLLTKEGLEAARKATPATSVSPPPTIRYIPGPAGMLAARVFQPDSVRAVVMSIHGGGWSLGTAAFDDELNEYIARTCKVVVVSVDYRLAPEHPFPACIADCKATAKWLVENAKREFGTDKLIISGASAGGHLSAEVVLYIRDSLKAIEKVRGVNLMYGCFDLSRTPSCRRATDSTLLINKKYLDETFELVFHGWSAEQLRDPAFSPLYADLENLPPALFTVGTADPLIDDTYFMEARWRLAGNKTYLAVYPESPHGFNYFPTGMAGAANEKICQWIIGVCDGKTK